MREPGAPVRSSYLKGSPKCTTERMKSLHRQGASHGLLQVFLCENAKIPKIFDGLPTPHVHLRLSVPREV